MKTPWRSDKAAGQEQVWCVAKNKNRRLVIFASFPITSSLPLDIALRGEFRYSCFAAKLNNRGYYTTKEVEENEM